MKKTLTKIVLMIVAVCMLATSFIACGGTGWDNSKVTLKNWGAVKTQGGFVAETDNYIYFINGIGNSTEDNTFGTPIKGALMAADKSDLTKTCIVVPKIFGASDYEAGVAIYGDYVYYGTPSTDTNSAGSTANDELVFMKTKLDGSTTEKFFSIGSLYTEYRILKGADGDVYIVYYDTENTQIVSYNTTTKTSKVIIKTDAEAESESLDAYNFILSDSFDETVVLFTTTIYTQTYSEEAAKDPTYSRATAKYNKVYAYKVGDEEAKEVLSGEGVDTKTYSITLVNNGYVFYKETVVADSSEKTFAIKLSDLYNKNINDTTNKLVKNTSYVAEKTLLINDLENVYTYVDSKIIKTGLLVNDNATKKIVAEVSSLTHILFEHGDYLYFMADGKLSRAKINNVDESNEIDVSIQRVSEDTISASWYLPQLVGDLVLYIDVSDNGQNYVRCINVATATVEEEVDEDDDSTEVTYYLTGNMFIGMMTDADVVNVAQTEMSKITEALDDNSEIELTEVDGKYENEVVKETRAIYEGLTDAQKKLITDETLQTLKDYEKAIELANVMLENLPDPAEFIRMTETERKAFEDAYNTVKGAIEALENNSDYEFDVIYGYVDINLRFTYQELENLFTESES